MSPRAAVHRPLRSNRQGRLTAGLCAGALAAMALVALITTFASAATAGFSDVPASHRYYAAITELASRGVIGGYPDGTFGPDRPVTRQQFAKMIVLAAGYPVSESDVCPFVDVAVSGPGSLYPDNYVAVAAAAGITRGTNGGGVPGRPGYVPATEFSPAQNITRRQVVTMVLRTAQTLYPGLLVAPPAAWQGNARWTADPTHGANAALAEYNGLLAGLDLAGLDPSGAMSRGEVAQVLYNFLGSPSPPVGGTLPDTAEIPGAVPLAFGEIVSGSLAVFDQVDVYSFAGNAGDTVLIRLVRASGTLWMGLGLFLPDGQMLDGGYGVPTVEISSYTLPGTGLYVIAVGEGYDGQNTGDYCLYIQRLNDPAHALPIVPGQTVGGSIESEAQMDTYTFTARAGEKVDVRMNQLTGIMWAGFRIYTPTGVMLSEQRSPHTAEVTGLLLPVTGTYSILAFDGWYGFRLGTYDLSLVRR